MNTQSRKKFAYGLTILAVIALAGTSFAGWKWREHVAQSRASAAEYDAVFGDALSSGVSDGAARAITEIVLASGRVQTIPDAEFSRLVDAHAAFDGRDRAMVEKQSLGLIVQAVFESAVTPGRRAASMATVLQVISESQSPDTIGVAAGCAQDLGIEQDAAILKAVAAARTRYPHEQFMLSVLDEVYKGVPSYARSEVK